MGITVSAARLIAKWVVDFNITGSCLEIARQDILITQKQFERELKKLVRDDKRRKPHVQAIMERLIHISCQTKGCGPKDKDNKKRMSDQHFFHALGFDEVLAVDASSFEGADIVHDLNLPGLASHLPGGCDFAVETGTAEHLFHIPNYLQNIAQILKVHGHVMHLVPVNNFVDHGFYQFSPTLFHDYYKANRFTIQEFLILESKSTSWKSSRIYEYQPGAFDTLARKRFSNRFVAMAILARKETDSTNSNIPQQRIYADSVNWLLSRNDVEPDSLPLVARLAPPYRHESGYCWSAALPGSNGDSASAPRQSRLVLFENNKPLREAHALHEEIRKFGQGRYSHWGETILFSTSDNTDPNTNGRQYEVRRIE